jgi:YrhK-like protein
MAVLFSVGSLCFMVGAIVTQWSSTSRPAIGVVFFVGSIFFTTAAYLQFAEVRANGNRTDVVSALVQLIGTVLFNISTFTALRHNLTTHQQNARVWAPDAFGSIAFLVSSGLAFHGVCGRWWCFRWGSRDWNVAALNLLGSLAFGISAIASLVEPSTGEPVSAHIANSGTSAGGACFLIAALMLVPAAAAAGSSRSDDAARSGDGELAAGEPDPTTARQAGPLH